MDPDEALRVLRATLKRVEAAHLNADLRHPRLEPYVALANDIPELVAAFAALDDWLTAGGFLPAAWTAKPTPA